MGKKKGFTLVELLLGVGIAVLVFGGLLSVINYTSTLRETARNKVSAMNAARQRIEQIKYEAANDFDGTLTRYTTTPAFFPVGVGQQSAGRVTMTAVSGGSGNLYDVRIIICWLQGNRIIGECRDNSGLLQFSDLDGDGSLESPCVLTTAIRRP